MIHEQLDIAHWKQVFSVARMRAAGQKPDGSPITGPSSIAVTEQWRDEAFATFPDIERVPADIFILNRGEPEQRAVTKIGGLPYRSAGKPWPLAPSGIPMTFVAQFCFVDSLDLVPQLPGDLLLIFIEGKEWRYGQEVGYDWFWGYGDHRDSLVTFEWVSLGAFPLITGEEMPEIPWKLKPFYGSIYRTWDYPKTDGFVYPAISEYIATTLDATKIGGAPPYPWLEQDHLGTYLCTLNSVFRESGPYPFLNVPEPILVEEWRENWNSTFMVGDMELMNFFLATDGRVRWIGDHG